MNDSSAELQSMAAFAMEHAVASVVPAGGPLIPFTVIEAGGERSMQRFVTEMLEDGQAQAREYARNRSAADRAAVAYDGYITIEGKRTDALFVEASEAGCETSVLIAQRYATGGLFKKTTATIGESVFVGNGKPLFSTVTR